MTDIVDVDITGPDTEWLAEFGRSLVADRLAASVNLSRGVTSFYRWKGAVHEGPEARLVLHTRRELVPAILDRVEREHPYDLPGVRVLEVEVPDSYRAWIEAST